MPERMLLGSGLRLLALVASPYQLPLIVLIVGGLQTGSVLARSYLLRVFALFCLPLLVLLAERPPYFPSGPLASVLS